MVGVDFLFLPFFVCSGDGSLTMYGNGDEKSGLSKGGPLQYIAFDPFCLLPMDDFAIYC